MELAEKKYLSRWYRLSLKALVYKSHVGGLYARAFLLVVNYKNAERSKMISADMLRDNDVKLMPSECLWR